jgi:hypothetical protein
MRKVLLVCYYFPPLGLGGVGRPLNLYRELASFGWECHVLTVKPVAYRAYEPELLDGLDVRHVYRSGSRDPQRLMYLLGLRQLKASTIARSAGLSERFFPDAKSGWVKPAVALGRVLCENHRYDAIITTSPPVSCHLVGAKLQAEFGAPWIADFRDYWTIHPIEDSYSSPRMIDRARQLLERIKTQATAITAVNDMIGDHVGAGQVIHNGYLAEYGEQWRQPPCPDTYTLGMVGHFHGQEEPRQVIELLQALQRAHPEVSKRTRLLQVGLVDEPWLRGVFERAGVAVELVCAGFKSRRETVATLAAAHVLLLRTSSADTSAFMPGRTFELIASGRPMVVFARADGAIVKLLSEWPYARCFEDADAEGAASVVAEQFRLFESGQYAFEPVSQFARRFSSTSMVQRFAAVLDGVV